MQVGKKYKILAGPTREDFLNSFTVGNEFNRYPITFTLEGGEEDSRITMVVNGADRGGENDESNQEFEFRGRLVERDVLLHGLYSVRRDADRGWIEFDAATTSASTSPRPAPSAAASWVDRK